MKFSVFLLIFVAICTESGIILMQICVNIKEKFAVLKRIIFWYDSFDVDYSAFYSANTVHMYIM